MTQQTETPTPVDLAAWYRAHRRRYMVDGHDFGPLRLFEWDQPAGDFSGPAADGFALQVPIVAEGRHRFDFGAGRYEGRDNSMHVTLSPADTDYWLETTGATRGLCVYLPAAFITEAARDLAPDFNGDFGRLHAGEFVSEPVKALAAQLWRASMMDFAAPEVDPDEMALQMAQLLFTEAEKPALQRRPMKLSPRNLRLVTDYIEAHLDDDLRLGLLADLTGLSPYHFARSFRAEAGISPHAYVIDRRLRRAQALIRTADMALCEVAIACGFASQQHMNAAFRKFLGRTPCEERALAANLHYRLPPVADALI